MCVWEVSMIRKRVKRLNLVLGTIVILGIVMIIIKASLDSKVLKYEENKYGVMLKIKNYNLITKTGILYPKNDKSKMFYVTSEKKSKDKNYTYEDGYVYRLLEPLLYERIEGISQEKLNNFKYSVLISNSNNSYLSLPNRKYNKQPDLDDFFKHENKSLVTIKTVVNYGHRLNKKNTASKINEFIKKLMENKMLPDKIKVSFEFYFVNSNDFEKADVDDFKFRDRKEIVEDKIIKNCLFINSISQLNYKDKAQNIYNAFEK